MNGLIRLEDAIKAINDTPCHSEFIRATFRCAISALSQEPYICDSCKHKDAEWDTEPCDGCCGNHSGYEPCDDAISREAAIKTVHKMRVVCDTEDIDDYYELLVESFKQLPSVTQKSGKWIPVSEKLPSDCNEDWVLAQIQEDNGHLWIPCVAEYRKNTDDWYSDANDIGWLKNHRGCFKVIAWMPLPKPYEPQESEEQG